MPGIKVKDAPGKVLVLCPECGRHHWVRATKTNTKLRRTRCAHCCPTKICNRCGRQYKKSHRWCPAENKSDGFAVLDGDKRSLKPHSPRDKDRFSTVICLHDWTHFHLADVKTTGFIVAYCDRSLVASHPLPAIAIDFWGMLAMDATESPSYAGPWCRRCLALANRLIGKESKFRVVRES